MTNTEKAAAIRKATREFLDGEFIHSTNHLVGNHILTMCQEGLFDNDPPRVQRELEEIRASCRYLERAILDAIHGTTS